MRCGLGPHQVENGCYITEPHYVKFVKRAIVDFRPQTEVCLRCKNSVVLMYAKKRKSLRMKLRALSTVDSLSSSDGKSNAKADDSLDNILKEGPRYKTLRSLRASLRDEQSSALSPLKDSNQQTSKDKSHSKSPGYSSSSSSSSNTLTTLAALANSEPLVLAESIAAPTPPQQASFQTDNRIRSRTASTSSVVTVVSKTNPGAKPTTSRRTATPAKPPKSAEPAKSTNNAVKPAKSVKTARKSTEVQKARSPEPMPSTSAAALASARRSNTASSPAQPAAPVIGPPVTGSSSDDDDDILNAGINVLKGVRLPHVQPASRKRPFTSDNPHIMDIYLQGTTGG